MTSELGGSLWPGSPVTSVCPPHWIHSRALGDLRQQGSLECQDANTPQGAAIDRSDYEKKFQREGPPVRPCLPQAFPTGHAEAPCISSLPCVREGT